jgi:hypothetical protein
MRIATPSPWGIFTSYSLPVLIGAPEIKQTVRKLPFIVTRGEAGQDEDDKISVTPDGQFCG